MAKARLPAIYEHRDFVAVSGLMSYATKVADLVRRVAASMEWIRS